MKLKAYGKINLTLDVVGRRADGYHLLDTVMQSVSLCDLVEVVPGPAGQIRVFCDRKYLPTDRRNSAYQAAQAFFEATGTAGGCTVRLTKRIPSRAGLGGGSADAAAVLVGLNGLYGEPLDREQLRLLGARVGADVAFCLFGGTLRCGGIGEELTPVPPLPDCQLVLCKPPAGVSTPRAFALLDQAPGGRTHATPRLLEALEAGGLEGISRRLYNRFEEALRLMQVKEIKAAMTSGGALGTLMTGSGSVVYGIFDSAEAAGNAVRLLEGKGEIYRARPVRCGVERLN